ncbi:MAG: hypothetical protein KatS3mg105_3313 [Gemmatales bacterium]|nr:MAG: hypothetical protein KatS3mg105_3313 [Gemmatales bacterium]
MLFGRKIKAARQAAGLSQSELAKKAGVPVDSLQNWEQDRRKPTLPNAIALAKALGLALDELVERGMKKE